MEELSKSTVLATFGESHPYLSGMFAPVRREITATELTVVGEIPRDVSGMFVRNGSNPQFAPPGRYHWFDGDGMLHGVHLVDGRATYRNRYVRTRGWVAESEAGQSLYTGIMEPPTGRTPDGPFKNTANTDVVFHAGRLLALWWLGGDAHQARLPDLETVARYNFDGQLRRGITAHPKVDPRTGEMMFFDYSPRPPFMYYGVVAATGQIVHQVPISLPGARLQHDMAITEHYSILFDFPMFWDPRLLAQGKARVVFDPHMPSRFGILPRLGDETSLRWFEAPACYMYHTINAFEEGDEIVLIGCAIDNPLPPKRSAGATPRLDVIELAPYLTRWRFNLATGTSHVERLDDVPTEFPRMNNQQLGRPARYSYNPRIARADTLQFDGLIKYDLATGTSQTLSYGPGRFGGEAVFAPRASGQAEDDGYLFTFVYDEQNDQAELWIIDAARFEGEPVARVAIPQRVPIGYHACWVSEAEIRGQRLPA
ncbi:MAG: carotenoid oxygenase family protein [Pirellulales bacterium]|nr:carotenoid oxygenase family protein [Pirellulales bacterium]